MPSLGKDLAAVRTSKSLSIEDVQQATKVPQHILRSIEDDSLFSQIDQNTTYVRSYVRSYAKAIGIKEEKIVRALDQVEAGGYAGGIGPADTSSGQTPDATDHEASAEDEASPTNDADQQPVEKPESRPQESDHPKAPHRKKKRASAGGEGSLDWVDVGRKVNPTQTKSRVWSGLLIIVLIVAVIAAGFLLYNYYNQDGTEEFSANENPEAIEPTTPSDSLRESLIAKNTEPAASDTTPVEQGVLSDTLTIAIYAANGKLEPVRVYTDILGKQNPYWVPQGDTIRFNFVNTVRIRAVNQYDRLQLLFNGNIMQDYYQQHFNPESGMVEFDRSVFEENYRGQNAAGEVRP